MGKWIVKVCYFWPHFSTLQILSWIQPKFWKKETTLILFATNTIQPAFWMKEITWILSATCQAGFCSSPGSGPETPRSCQITTFGLILDKCHRSDTNSHQYGLDSRKAVLTTQIHFCDILQQDCNKSTHLLVDIHRCWTAPGCTMFLLLSKRNLTWKPVHFIIPMSVSNLIDDSLELV